MARIRKTESRIPAGIDASQLGQAMLADDGRSALVSFITSPMIVGRANTYVLFVTDATLAAQVNAFEWTYAESEGESHTHNTDHGEDSYTPQTVGGLTVTVRILDIHDTVLGQLTLDQGVLPPNTELEMMISSRRGQPGAASGNIEVARELVSDHNPYYQNIAPAAPGDETAFRRFVFGLVYNGALRRTPEQRRRQAAELAASLNGDDYDFSALIAEGIGVCGIRFPLLAMSLPADRGSSTFLAWRELPEPQVERSHDEAELRQACAQLAEPIRLDLFNLARFPKSNIALCGRVVELLRNRYFPGANFTDVMTGLSGTRAHWIIKHFRLGPLQSART